MSTITTQAGRAVKDSGRESVAGSSTTKAPRRIGLHVTPKLLWTLVVLALVATVALAATRGREWYAARQTEQANSAALSAAKQLAVNFVTVDYQKVDADTNRVKAGATGEFLKSYSASVDQLKKVLVANKSVSSVQRTEAALVSGDRDSAVALVGVVAPNKNTCVPDGETKTYRMRLDLRLVGEQWKVENLEFVG
jgi:Mce-associated membrane protein